MNKIKSRFLLPLILLTFNLYGDIIITDYPPARICARIKNPEDFPDIAVIGLSDCMALSKADRAYVIESDSCLEVHKACPLTLYAVKKGYLEKKGLKKIKWKNDKNVIQSNLSINAKTITPKGPVQTVELYFNIAGFDDDSMILYKTTQILHYSDGRKAVQQFEYDGDISKLRKKINE